MRPQILILLATVAGATSGLSAQTNLPTQTRLSTNLIYPSLKDLYVGAHITNVASVGQAEWVSLPASANFNLTYKGPVDATVHYLPLRATVYLQRPKGTEHYGLPDWQIEFTKDVTMMNYPFVRNQWVYTSDRGWKPIGGNLATLAVRVNASTNYDIQGVIRSVKETFDCGLPDTVGHRKQARIPIPTPEQVAAAQVELAAAIKDATGRIRSAQQAAESAAAAKKQAQDARVLKMNQELADKGDAAGLMRMGERYRDGQGVEKDLLRAKSYFSKAADAGLQDAESELTKLTLASTNSPPAK